MATINRQRLRTDETYRPGYMKNGNHHYWRAPRRYVQAGWNRPLYPLRGDDAQMARMCRELTSEMLDWYEHRDDPLNPSTKRHTVVAMNSLKSCGPGKFFSDSMAQARKRAKRRGQTYALPEGWAAEQFVKQGGLCALTGMRMHQDRRTRSPYLPTIDRKDCSRGYEPDNCRLVTLMANVARAHYTDEEFYEMCRAATQFAS